jgi:signal peptidase I
LKLTKAGAGGKVEEAKKPRSGEPSRNAIAEWAVTIVLLLFGTTSLVQAFVIPTGSMEDTLLIGDHLLVDKLAYSPADSAIAHLLPYEEPKHGDIIVFRYPVDIRQTFVKRLIGVPGDRIQMIDRAVYRNGKKLDEPYTYHKVPWPNTYRDNFPKAPDPQVLDRGMEMLERNLVNGEVVVPPGNYFAMGDNLDQSLDSRYWGFVPRENIVGKPLIIYWSYEASTEELTGPTVSADHITDLFMHFFSRTRWQRTFMLIHGYTGN